MRDPGTFWHVVVGERILQAGLPTTDWLSFTAGGHPWIAQQWAAEVGMAALHRLGGLDALLVATTGAVALLLAWLFHRAVRAGLSGAGALLLVGLVFLASAHHLHVRPHVATIVLFAWTCARLADFEAGRIGLRGLVPLVPAFVIWVNCHGGVVGGVATLAFASTWWIGAFLAGRASPIRTARAAAALATLVAGCAAAIFVNPYGVALPRAWLAILRSPEISRLVVEHGSIAATGSWQVLALGAAYLGALVAARRSTLGATSLIPLVWLALAAERVRHAPLFAVAAALAVPELVRGSRAADWLSRHAILRAPASVASARTAGFPRVACAAVVLGVALVPVAHAMTPRRDQPLVAALDETRWPVSLVPAIDRASRALPDGAPVLNDFELGGFLAYRAPRLRVFADDRFELYGDDFLRRASTADAAWVDAWVECSGVTLAVVSRGGALEGYVRRANEWRVVASSPAAVLLAREPVVRASGACPPL